MLGIFDSGLGGLTVLRRLRTLMPEADFLYFADQRHVPYGDRPDEDLRRLLHANVAYLCGRGASAIVLGCNTSCAIAARYGWPPLDVPVFDLIDAATEAVRSSGARRVGVLSTTATARIGAYGQAIRARCEGVDVREAAAPALVPLVEAGIVDGPIARTAVRDACAALGDDRDALVLACTHFPLLEPTFEALFGGALARIDPAEAQARRVAAWVGARTGAMSHGGLTRFVTSGRREPFLAGLVGFGVALDEMENVEEKEHGQPAERRAGEHLRDGVCT